MKNLLKIFGIFSFSLLIFASCQKDIQELSEFDIAIQKYIDQAQNQGFEALPVERITLEELNEIFLQNGIEPITEEELTWSRSVSFRTCDSADCDAISSYGDINDSGTITAADLVIANNAFQDCDDNYSLTLTEIAACSEISPHNSRLWLAGHAVHTGEFGSNTIFDTCDYYAIRDYILGIICT